MFKKRTTHLLEHGDLVCFRAMPELCGIVVALWLYTDAVDVRWPYVSEQTRTKFLGGAVSRSTNNIFVTTAHHEYELELKGNKNGKSTTSNK